MVVTGGSDLGQAGLAVLIFGIVMVSLYLVVRAGVRAGMEEAWKRMNAEATPPSPTPPAPAPAPAQRAADESESESGALARADDE